jgi:acyl carrier protein
MLPPPKPAGRCVVPAETHVERGPMDRQEVFELIRDRLADILEIEPSAITEGASFSDDLEADSLALIELVEALEEELKTVRDAVDYVVGRL